MQQPTDQSVGQRINIPGQYLDIALQCPLICLCKVLHNLIWLVDWKPDNHLKWPYICGSAYNICLHLKQFYALFTCIGFITV